MNLIEQIFSSQRGGGGFRAHGVAELERRDLDVRTIQVRAESVDEGTRSVEAVFATDERVQVFDMRTWEIIDEILPMDAAIIPRQVVFLNSHRRFSDEDVRGSGRDLRREGGHLIGRLYFAGDTASLASFEKVRDGHIQDVSSGYLVHSKEDIPRGESREVGGVKYTAGDRTLRVGTRWEVKEISVVPIGADPNAKIRSDERGEQKVMNVKLRKYLEGLGLRSEATDSEAWKYFQDLSGPERQAGDLRLTDEEKREEGSEPGTGNQEPGTRKHPPESPLEGGPERARGDSPVRGVRGDSPGASLGTVPGTVPDAGAIAARAVETERERVRGLRTLAGDDVPGELLQRSIDEGWDEPRASREFLEAVRAGRSAAPHIRVGVTGGENLRADLTTALCAMSGERMETDEEKQAVETFRGVSLVAAAEIALRSEGVSVRYDRNELYQRAVSSMAYGEILGTVGLRRLRKAYSDKPGTLSRWAGKRTVQDFREVKDISMSSFSNLVKVGNAGELEHGALGDKHEVYSAQTYGRRFGVSRQMFINDDLGAFARIPMMLGRACAKNIDDLGYALLVLNSGVGPTMNEDSVALFATSRSTPNYKTGATASALGETGLTNAKLLMRKIRGVAPPDGEGDGDELNLTPRYLLVPPELEHTALKNIHSTEIMVASGADGTVYHPTKNVHQGSVEVITEGRLSGATNGATAWYLLADPGDAETIVIVELAGHTGPQIERVDPTEILGMGWRIYHDAGVNAVDWRGAVRSKGAS